MNMDRELKLGDMSSLTSQVDQVTRVNETISKAGLAVSRTYCDWLLKCVLA